MRRLKTRRTTNYTTNIWWRDDLIYLVPWKRNPLTHKSEGGRRAALNLPETSASKLLHGGRGGRGTAGEEVLEISCRFFAFCEMDEKMIVWSSCQCFSSWTTLKLIHAGGSSSVEPRFMKQIFLISSLFHAATDVSDMTVDARLITNLHFILNSLVPKMVFCVFIKSPFALLLFISFDLSHHYLLLLQLEPSFPSGTTTTNLVYWYFSVASSHIIRTNCSEFSYRVSSLSLPEASGFTDGVCVCVRVLIRPSLYKSFLFVVRALEGKATLQMHY